MILGVAVHLAGAQDSAITLENAHLSLGFDSMTGALIRLENRETGDNYLKGESTGGSPFRAYVDTEDVLPTAAKAGMPFSVTPVEDAMGGSILDPGSCRLVKAVRDERGLTIHSEHRPTGLEFVLRAAVDDGSHTVSLGLQIRNAGEASRRVMVAFPYLTGLLLGQDAATNRGVHLRGWGKAGGPAWTRQGGMYGAGWNMQWNAVWEPSIDEGLGLICIDREMLQKPGRIFRRFEPGGMSVVHYPALELKPGRKADIMSAELLVHRGNWRVVAKEYRREIRKYIRPRRVPDWFRVYPAGSWLNFPDPEATAAAKKRGEDPTFAKLMARRAAGVFYMTQGYGWQQEFLPDGHFPTYHGEYDRVREDLGGVGSLREGVRAAKRLGRKPFVTVATVSIHPGAHWLKGKNPRDYWLMSSPSPTAFPGDGDYKNFFADVRYEPYQEHFSAMIGRLISNTGLDGIYLDEGGGDYYGPNFNSSLKGRSPYALGENYPGIAFHRKLRAAVDAANPDAVITSENKNEMTLPFLDGAHHNTHPGREIQPFRVVFPEFGSECLVGAIPALLNNHGSIVQHTIAYQWRTGFGDAHQESIKGKGSHAGKPSVLDGMSDEEITARTPTYRYAELRPTLRDWALHGEATDEDPVALVPDTRAEEFVGRLWKTRDYWLLTAGHQLGWEQPDPVKFRLPELPGEITTAWEFDLETLEVAPTSLYRGGEAVFVTLTHGFSAVLLPTPDCPPMVVTEWDFSHPLVAGETARIDLALFAPWQSRDPTAGLEVSVTCPGLSLDSERLMLPASIGVDVPKNAWSGFYYLEAKAKRALPLWRTLRVSGR